MAEDLNQQEPTAEEKAKFEQDVLKAAEEAMKMEAEANKADNAQADASTEQPAEAAEKPAESAEAAPSAEEVLKQQLADATDRNLRLMAEFDNFRRRSARRPARWNAARACRQEGLRRESPQVTDRPAERNWRFLRCGQRGSCHL